MSHCTRVKTGLTDEEVLKEVLAELGCEFRENLTKDQRCEIVARFIRPSPAATTAATRTLQPRDINFQKVGEAFEVFAQWYFVGMEKEAFLSLITKQYAYRVAVRKFEEQGFEVTRQEEEDGKTRLTLSRTVLGQGVGGLSVEEQAVQVAIGRDGEVSLATRGFKGERCLTATKGFEDALGAVTHREMLPELDGPGGAFVIPRVPGCVAVTRQPPKEVQKMAMPEPEPGE